MTPVRREYELFLIDKLNKYLAEVLAPYRLPKDTFVLAFSYETLTTLEMKQKMQDFINVLHFHGADLKPQTFYLAILKIVTTKTGTQDYLCLDCVPLKDKNLQVFFRNTLLGINKPSEQQMICSNLLTVFGRLQTTYLINIFRKKDYVVTAHKTFLNAKESTLTTVLQLQEDVKISQSMLSWLYQNFGVKSVMGHQKIDGKMQVILRLTANF